MTVCRMTYWCNNMGMSRLNKFFGMTVQRKQYQIEIANRLAAIDNLSDSEDINGAKENIKGNMKTSAKESLGLHKLKHHKPWFNDGFLGFLEPSVVDKHK